MSADFLLDQPIEYGDMTHKIDQKYTQNSNLRRIMIVGSLYGMFEPI